VKIGYASRYDPRDKKTWSGTGYYTLQQLKRFGEVEIFQYPLPKLLQEWLTTQKSINQKYFKKNTSVEYLKAYSKYFSRKLAKDLKKRPVDILFVAGSSQMIAYVKTDIPIIYMTDATFQQLQGYYNTFNNLANYNINEGIELDRKAFHKATHCMLASKWNRDSAIKDYGVAEKKISVVPFGANLDFIPSTNELNFDITGRCNLLFLGVEWERKGGEIMLQVYKMLKDWGINLTLHIIGCVPPEDLSSDKNIIVIPFLDKNKSDEAEQLNQILQQTDFLILPTRSECAGIVYCEASAHGIISITTDTGGISSYILDGINGFRLPLEAAEIRYAEKIKELLMDIPKHSAMKKSSRTLYETELNWKRWGDEFGKIAQAVTNNKNNYL